MVSGPQLVSEWKRVVPDTDAPKKDGRVVSGEIMPRLLCPKRGRTRAGPGMQIEHVFGSLGGGGSMNSCEFTLF